MDTKKKRKLAFVISLVSAVAVIGVVVFAVGIQGVLRDAEAKGRDALEVFAEQTSHRLEDAIGTNMSILSQLKEDLGSDAQTFPEADTVLKKYFDNWEMQNIGFLTEDRRAIGFGGEEVSLRKWIDPIDVSGYAYGVCVTGNDADGEAVMSFSIGWNGTLDGQPCIGLFLNEPLSFIDGLMGETVYGNDKSTFIAIIEQSGETVWRSEAENVIVGGTNMFDDLAQAQFEHPGDLDVLKARLELNYSGNVVYEYRGERKVMAYVPLRTNSWKMTVGISYEALISQKASYVASFVMIAAITIVLVLSIGLALYFVYRQRATELERQKTEAAARLARSETEAKSEFLSRMSHELRTPLNGIVGMLELVDRYGDDREKRNEYLGKIKKSSRYLMSIISDILDMSLIENGKIEIAREPFDFVEICDEIEDMFLPLTAAKNLCFSMNRDGLTHRTFVGDELRLKQIITNLLSNAVKFTDAGEVSCEVIEENPEENSALVTIRISDTGRGIGTEFADRLFTPFEQEDNSIRKQKEGSGLGLAITASFVKLMGGEIAFESEAGRGTAFTVKLPLALASESEAAVLEPVGFNLSGIRILLAEDNEINAEIAVALLMAVGAEVTLVRDGNEAAETFVRSVNGTYDVLLMDIQMPVKDGILATREIRESEHPQAKTIPIIAMTANALAETRDRVLDAGMNDYLTKPIFIEKVCSAILKYCGKKGAV